MNYSLVEELFGGSERSDQPPDQASQGRKNEIKSSSFLVLCFVLKK